MSLWGGFDRSVSFTNLSSIFFSDSLLTLAVCAWWVRVCVCRDGQFGGESPTDPSSHTMRGNHWSNLVICLWQERLRSHERSFDGLLSLIPAKYYYGEDTSVSLHPHPPPNTQESRVKYNLLSSDGILRTFSL